MATTSPAWATSAAGSPPRRGLASRSIRACAASELVYDDAGAVKGVVAGVFGIGKDGQPTADYQPGIELHAKYTFMGEGRARSL